MSAQQDTADINTWLKVMLAEPMSLAQRMALSNIAQLCVRRAIEAEHFKERLEARRGLTVVDGGAAP